MTQGGLAVNGARAVLSAHFPAPRKYGCFYHIHPHMKAEIIVTE